MKNFLVFHGQDYYPEGGMDDFHSEFDTLDEAIQCIENMYSDKETWAWCWANVYSVIDREKVYTKKYVFD